MTTFLIFWSPLFSQLCLSATDCLDYLYLFSIIGSKFNQLIASTGVARGRSLRERSPFDNHVDNFEDATNTIILLFLFFIHRYRIERTNLSTDAASLAIIKVSLYSFSLFFRNCYVRAELPANHALRALFLIPIWL